MDEEEEEVDDEKCDVLELFKIEEDEVWQDLDEIQQLDEQLLTDWQEEEDEDEDDDKLIEDELEELDELIFEHEEHEDLKYECC